MPTRPTLLYVSNLTYPAKGRRYCDEDIYLTAALREAFNLAICHPTDAANLMTGFDTVVVRNSGPVIDYPDAYQHFRAQANATAQRVYNPLTGKADMAGKQYLIDLTDQGYPVIPTIDTPDHLDRLPQTAEYVVKPKAGADSHGLEFTTREGLAKRTSRDLLIQPKIDFRYEVSFYFVDHDFQYALNAPDPAKRWELTRYDPTEQDREFAQRFIDWNDLDHGIQRVDACRTREGDLLLVELEDLNPYLSLDRTADRTRTEFTKAVISSIQRSLET